MAASGTEDPDEEDRLDVRRRHVHGLAGYEDAQGRQGAGLDYDINACATTMAEDVGGDADCVLLGPQVRFQLDTVQKKLSCPVGVIDMKDYGRQNAEAVLAQACELMGEDA